MQTALTDTADRGAQPVSERSDVERLRLLGRDDLRNLSLILLVFLCVIALVPPVRSHPIMDDWSYSRSVTDLLNGAYKIPEWAQPSAFAHIAWGALFVAIFGHSFTTLAGATLVMSAACLAVFYLLLRSLDVPPAGSLLGVAVLGFNPLYVYLSYTFMTDVTFLAFLLAASLCYVRGLQGHGERWLWLGSGLAALAFLTRQIGLLLVLSALGYLWWARRWTWRQAAAVAAIPSGAAIAYLAWERTQPTPLISYALEGFVANALQRPAGYVLNRLQVAAVVLSMLGLYMAPLYRRPRHLLLALPVFLCLALFLVRNLRSSGTVFPVMGNIVDRAGFNLGSFYVAPIWSEWAWAALGFAGAALFSLLVAAYLEVAWAWLRARRAPGPGPPKSPAPMLYIFGLLLAVATFVISLSLFDRYALPLLPVLILASARRLSAPHEEERLRPQGWRWLLVLPIALFAIVGERDFMEHASARWRAAEELDARGAPLEKIDGGFEWVASHLYDEGARRIRERGDYSEVPFPSYLVLDPEFAVSDVPRDGYEEIGSLPYRSWLSGGQTRRVLLLRRQ